MSFLIGTYCRVSTEEQAAVVEGSMDNQRHRIQTFVDFKNAQEKGWGKIADFYIDDGYSAKDTNRPAYQRMLKDLKKGKINMILVTELSRLSRNIPDFCNLLEDLEDFKGKFLSIKEQFDTSTPAGEMMIYNMINLAQFERKQISERVAINCHSRAMRGLNSGGVTVMGYDKNPDNKATFIVNEEEAKTVRKIFDLFLEHGTVGKTIPVLEALNIRPKARNATKNRLVLAGRWANDSLRHLLQNPVYIGIKEINRHNKDKDQSHLKVWQKYGEAKASWPAIVDEGVFKKVQDRLDANRSSARLRIENGERRVFLLSGLLKCGECGRALVGSSAHGKNQVHRYYVHTSKKGDVIDCTIKRTRAEEIEDALENHLSEILIRAGYFDKIEQQIRKVSIVRPENLKAQRQVLQKQLDEIQKTIQTTFRNQSTVSQESEAIKLFTDELESLGRTRRILAAELENLKAKENQEEDVNLSVIDLKERLESFNRGWKKATVAMKKDLLKDLLDALVVVPTGIRITYRLLHKALSQAGGSNGDLPATQEAQVIELAAHKTKKPNPSDRVSSATCSSFDSENGAIGKLQVAEYGREYRIRTCDIHLVRVALYQFSFLD